MRKGRWKGIRNREGEKEGKQKQRREEGKKNKEEGEKEGKKKQRGEKGE